MAAGDVISSGGGTGRFRDGPDATELGDKFILFFN